MHAQTRTRTHLLSCTHALARTYHAHATARTHLAPPRIWRTHTHTHTRTTRQHLALVEDGLDAISEEATTMDAVCEALFVQRHNEQLLQDAEVKEAVEALIPVGVLHAHNMAGVSGCCQFSCGIQ